MEIQPIKTEKDYKKALRTIEEIWGAKENTSKGDRLDVLITLVDAYEATHHPSYPPDPVAAIEFHMDQNQLERSDIEKYIGTRARAPCGKLVVPCLLADSNSLAGGGQRGFHGLRG